eukprot:g8864.t1
MVTVLPVPCEILQDAAHAQVVAWDERFHVSAEADAVVNAQAQSSAFGARDATGVEDPHDRQRSESGRINDPRRTRRETVEIRSPQAVKDVMPTEMSSFEELLHQADAAVASSQPLQVLDFGCGDGRYLRQFLRSAEGLHPRRLLRVVAYEVSAEALRSFHLQEGSPTCRMWL